MFDMASLMQMFQQGGGQPSPLGAMVGQMAGQGGGQMPPGGPGFGLGQQLVQNGQMAQPTGPQAQPSIMDRLAGMFGGQQPGAAGQMGSPDLSKLGPMAAQMMMQQQAQQQQQQQQPMPQAGPMAGQGMRGQPQTQAMQGYLAQGGGLQRRLVGRGY